MCEISLFFLELAFFVVQRSFFSFLEQIKFLEENMRREKYFYGAELTNLKKLIKEKTGYYIKNNCLLIQAFRRSSYAAENGGKSNEIFEFVGDQVLSNYVVKIIAKRCGSYNMVGDYTFRIRENRFTTIKQDFISNKNFAKIIDEWGIIDCLLVGKSDEKNEVYKQTKIKADLFESIIGAIAVESNWDDEILEKVVNQALNIDEKIDELIKSDYGYTMLNLDNAVSQLKEGAEKKLFSMPKYEFTGPEYLGYDEDGNPIWGCSCSIINDITSITRSVLASSKKDAKKAVAYLLLCEQYQVQNQYGVNDSFWWWKYKDGKLIPDRTKK